MLDRTRVLSTEWLSVLVLLAGVAGAILPRSAAAFGCSVAPADYVCTALDVPGSQSTRVQGINNAGSFSGYYEAPGANGFRWSAGGIAQPPLPMGAAAAYGFGLNEAGAVAGYALGSTGFRGFVWDGSTYTSLAYPGANHTFAYGINTSGAVVGSFQNSSAAVSGYLYDNGGYQTVNVAGARSTYLYGINDGGLLAGTYVSDTGEIAGFLGRPGQFSEIRAPGARQTYVRGLNNMGDVVGSYIDASGAAKGFARLTDGSFWTFSVADAFSTNAMDINDARTVVGFYALDDYFTHGFVANVKPLPIPPAAAMLAVGLTVLGATMRRRRGTQAGEG